MKATLQKQIAIKGKAVLRIFFKEICWKQSGPGDLPLCIDLIANAISSTVRSSSNSAAVAGSIERICILSRKSSSE